MKADFIMNGVTHSDFSGKVDQVEMPDMDFGTSDAGGWSVEDLLK